MAAMKDGAYRCSNATVSRALSTSGCTVLLKKMKKSPEIARYRAASHVLAARPDNTLLFILVPGSANMRLVKKTSSFSCPKITALFCIYCACKITKLAILISQGSAATQLRCGGQCNKYFVAHLLPNSSVKKIENRLIFAKVIGKSIEVPF